MIIICSYSLPGDVFSLRALSRFTFAFKERDSRGWLPMHAASVQPLAMILDTVLLGEHCLKCLKKVYW